MKLVWTYLKKYPKWLILDVLGAFAFVVVNLGLPTALARMIDQGIIVGNKDKVYFWAIVMFIVIAVAYAIQGLMGGTVPLREVVIMFYIANEALSLLENAAEFIPVPDKLKEVLLQLRDKDSEGE